jgi:hypothetical protein
LSKTVVTDKAVKVNSTGENQLGDKSLPVAKWEV